MSGISEPPPRLRNARACEACRASKSKCIYKTEREICQRCEENGSQCIVRTKARPMRTRASRPPGASPVNSKDTKFVLDLPALPSRDVNQDIEELNNHHAMIFADAREGSGQSSNMSLSASDGHPLIKQRKITLEQAENLLRQVKKIASYFPFVQIPDDATVPGMSRNSPFLLLALLTVASKPDSNLYHQMDHEFRRVCGQKIIVEGQKSLDYLQGLAVYISWSPIHSNPKNNQSFVYMNLAISLISDLGLDNDVPNAFSFITVNTRGLVENGQFTTAAKRAYLGCYCLAATLSLGFQKPSSIQYRNLMDSRGAELLYEEASSEIYYLVKLQRLWERIAETAQEPTSDEWTLESEIALQRYVDEFQELKMTTSPVIRSIEFVALQERFVNTTIYSYHLGFLRRSFYRYKSDEIRGRPENIPHERRCLDACKSFFEFLLSMADDSLNSFSLFQWSAIANCFLVLSRLTFAMAKDLDWTADDARSTIPMAMYLDSLCWRLQKQSSIMGGDQTPTKADPFTIFRMILETLKNSYLKRVAEITPSSHNTQGFSAWNAPRGHCPVKDVNLDSFFDSHISSTTGSSSEFSFGSSNLPIYHDIWSTMTGTWAKGDPVDTENVADYDI